MSFTRISIFCLLNIVVSAAFPARAQTDEQIISLVKQAIASSKSNDFRSAIDTYKKALAMSEARHGPVHPFIAGCLAGLADNYTETGQYERAIDCLKRSLAQSQQTLGEADHRNAMIFSFLSDSYQNIGAYDDAISSAKKGLELLISNEKQDHVSLPALLTRLANCYVIKSDYQNAESVIDKLLELDPRSTSAFTLLGSLRFSQGRVNEAKEAFEKSISLANEKKLDAFYKKNAWIHLANAEVALENYDDALALLAKSRKEALSTLGPDHPDMGRLLCDLAEVHSNMGDSTKARECYEQAIRIYSRTLDAQHPALADAKVSLAREQLINGKPDAALDNAMQAERIYLSSGNTSAPGLADCLGLIALIHQQRGDFSLAQSFSEQAMKIEERVSGSNHPRYLALLGESALTDMATGRYKEAKTKLQREAEEFGQPSQMLAYCLQVLGYEEEAKNTCIKEMSVRNKAFLRGLLMSERSRMALQQKYASTLGPEVEILLPEQVANQLLLVKGKILDSICEERLMARHISSGSSAQLLQKIKTLRAQIGQLSLHKRADTETAIDELTEQLAALQTKLAKEINGKKPATQSDSNLKLADIYNVLAPDQAFIEFFKFRDWKVSVTDLDKSTSYAAIVVLPRSSRTFLGVEIAEASPKTLLVKLGNSRELDDTIRKWREAIVQENAAMLEQYNKTLFETMWSPLAGALPQNTKQCIISPDGDLNFLSFAALAGGDRRFLGEKYDISYVGSGRDLTKAPSTQTSRSLSIVSDPDFEAASGSPPVNRQDDTKRFAAVPRMKLERLPGTIEEAKALENLASASGWSVSATSGTDATEASVVSVKNPNILHLATHGFYLNLQTGASSGARGMSVRPAVLGDASPAISNLDPMRASGIALAGAQHTLDAWAEGRGPEPDSDGVLTAEEIASLDLKSTWLVTLSACESGVGEARSGEGVFGMRRAFKIAGTDNLLMTLWPVDDSTTSQIMSSFYERALKSDDVGKSLANVQREWLVKLREEKGLVAAVREAGPFALVRMVNPALKPEAISVEVSNEVVASAESTSDKTVPDNHEVRKVQKEIDELKALIKVDGAAESKSAPKTVPKTRAKSDYRRELEDAKKQSEKLKAIIEGSE